MPIFCVYFSLENLIILKMENIQSPNIFGISTKINIQSSTRNARAFIPVKNKSKKTSFKNPANANCLSNIVELTQQHEPQGKTMIMQKVKSNDQELMDDIDQNENRNSKQQQTCFLSLIAKAYKKSKNCLVFTFSKLLKQVFSQDINIQQSQISQILSKLRNKKKARKLILLSQQQPSQQNKKTLVLDLDETLVFTSFKKPNKYDFQIQVQLKGAKMTLYVVKRFGLDAFLFQMSQYYELVIFSSLRLQFVEKIVQRLDPKKKITHVLGKQHCIVINKSYFIKCVRDLGRDPKKVIVVDSRTISASLNPQNLYRIQPYRGSQKDRKLVKLGYFLKYLHQNKDIKEVTPVEMHRRQFQTKQIKISDKQNIDINMKQNSKNKQIPHKKRNSQLDSLVSNPHQNSVGVFVKN